MADQPEVIITGDPAADAAQVAQEQFDGIGAALRSRYAQSSVSEGDGEPGTPPSEGPEKPDTPTPDTGTEEPATPPPPAEPEAPSTTDDDASDTASSFVVTLPDGSSLNLTQEDAHRLLALEGWARGLPDETRAAIAAVEAGQAAAVPISDFEQFQAWRMTQEQQRAQQQHVSALDNLDDLADPETVAAVRAMQQDNARLAAEVQRANDALTYGQLGAINQRVDNVRTQFEQGVEQWATQRGVDQPTADALLNYAIDSRVIPSLVQGAQTVNPVTGQVIIPADMLTVAARALDFALVQNPELHTQVLAGTASPVPAVNTAGNVSDLTALRRSRSASLASAPSASVSTPPVNAATMTHDEYMSAMQAAIGQARNGTTS